MNRNKLFFTFFISLILFWQGGILASRPPGLVENIASAIHSGDSRELSKYFNSSVELVLPGNDGVFSKAQAEMIMKTFFAKSAQISFNIKQKGNSTGGAQFIIGSYKSKAESLNVYILLKPINGVLMIHQMHFEAD